MSLSSLLIAPWRRRAFFGAAAAAAAFGWAAPASAGCTLAPQTQTLAPSTSYDVRAGVVPQIGGSAGLSCTGAALSVLGSSFARATITSANAFRLTATSGDQIAYAASADAGGTQPFTQGGTVDYMSAQLVSLLGLLSSTSLTTPMYVRLTSAPNIPAGTYKDRLTINWNYKVCNGVQVAGICVLYEQGQATITVDVTLVVGNDCRIATTDVAFGAAPLVSQFAALSPSVLVDCTKGTTYKVAFSTGRSGVARPWRTMTDGAGHALQYNLYRLDGVTIWDETNPLPSALPGTGGTTPSQVQSFVARVNPAQVTPPAGSYTDQVQVVVSF